jgi:hypothetical protein
MAIIIGHIGSDAGYTVIGADGAVHHVPGWQEAQLEEFAAAVKVLGAATRLKTPGAAREIAIAARDLIVKEAEAHIKGDAGDRTIVIVGG